jgi:curved DNA-binding protein CbpA
MNHYEVLGISPKANLEEIKAAYKRLAFRYHPDKNFGQKEAEEEFKKINEAYITLSNLRLRKQYDEKKRLQTAPDYHYHQGGLYRSMGSFQTKQPKHYPKPHIFETKKKDIDFYLFWLSLGIIFLLVGILMFKI